MKKHISGSAKREAHAAVRLKDVAERAGVSVSVVSKALHDTKAHVRMSASTRDRIRALASEMGYRPSAAGRMLAKRQTDVIGVITSYSNDAARVPRLDYVAELITPACRILWEHGKNLMVLDLPTESRHAGADVLPTMVTERRVDGVLVMEPSSNPVLCGELDRIGFPWVGVCAKQPEIMRPCNQVISETPAVTEVPVRHLVEKGHRRVCYLHYDIPYGQETCRHEGISRILGTCASVSVVRVPYQVLAAEMDERCGVSQMLQDRVFAGKRSSQWPTAVFCDNSRMAMAVYDAAAKKGLSIPGDLSVVAYGDSAIAALLDPMVATVVIDAQQACGAEMMLRRLATGEDQPNIECRPRYVPRGSVASVGRGR
jgi:LacI family transcriptional regulator